MPYHLPEVKLLYSHFYIYGPHPSQKKAWPFTIYDLQNSASGARETAKQVLSGILKARHGLG